MLEAFASAGGVEFVLHGHDDPAPAEPLVRRTFGLDADLRPFYRAAKRVDWLAPIVERMKGVRPPRYASLWEALVNAIVFQQVSIHAAGAILGRVVAHASPVVEHASVVLRPFPLPGRFLEIDAETLRSLGLSSNKVAALRGLATAIGAGGLDADELEPLPTPELIERLTAHPGIGPWTAAVVALRGFGRLDIFPLNDSGAARSLARCRAAPTSTCTRCSTPSVRSAECCITTCCSGAWKRGASCRIKAPAGNVGAPRAPSCGRGAGSVEW